MSEGPIRLNNGGKATGGFWPTVTRRAARRPRRGGCSVAASRQPIFREHLRKKSTDLNILIFVRRLHNKSPSSCGGDKVANRRDSAKICPSRRRLRRSTVAKFELNRRKRERESLCRGLWPSLLRWRLDHMRLLLSLSLSLYFPLDFKFYFFNWKICKRILC